MRLLERQSRIETELSPGRAIRLTVIDKDQILNRKAKTTGLFDDSIPGPARKIWPSRQNPKIAARWAGDGSPSIVFLIQRKHMIAASEWPEEGNGQTGYVWIALEYRTSVRLLPPTTLRIKASIENIDRAIVRRV